MNNFSEKVNFIWSIAELLRDRFKRGKYRDVIPPFTVLRRIDCVLAPTKAKVLEKHAKLKEKLENLDPQLRTASGFAFYNTSRFDFEKLLDDAPNLATNLRAYLNGFSENMREALGENPGEHFTPREVVRLMVLLLIAVDKEVIKRRAIVRTVCDPCCGTGGKLTTAKEQIREINPNAEAHMFGHESQPETFALCKADLYLVSADGRDADNIKYGSTLSNWQFGVRRHDDQCANPPYGKEWKMDQAAVEAEAERGDGAFGRRGRPGEANAARAKAVSRFA
ncbi:MAG TPA: type I restriction-modification system subunit M N-terminal domain-containing protein, partial [Dongiaceae bacterium]|nr:type I restriction-modification system subunit M N-terminal domain-containing protein [Dongiaceae bacterium]